MKNDICCTKYKDKDICKDKWQKGNWRNDETYQAALAVSLSGKDHYHQAGQGHLGEDIDEDSHDGGGDDVDHDDDDYDDQFLFNHYHQGWSDQPGWSREWLLMFADLDIKINQGRLVLGLSSYIYSYI